MNQDYPYNFTENRTNLKSIISSFDVSKILLYMEKQKSLYYLKKIDVNHFYIDFTIINVKPRVDFVPSKLDNDKDDSSSTHSLPLPDPILCAGSLSVKCKVAASSWLT